MAKVKELEKTIDELNAQVKTLSETKISSSAASALKCALTFLKDNLEDVHCASISSSGYDGITIRFKR